MDVFFVNWILHPTNDGVSPGHLSNLPELYIRAPVESALWNAIRAMAIADLRHTSHRDVPFYVKARRYYGSVLTRLRSIANDTRMMTEDCTLAALLIIDNFEVCSIPDWAMSFACTSSFHQ